MALRPCHSRVLSCCIVVVRVVMALHYTTVVFCRGWQPGRGRLDGVLLLRAAHTIYGMRPAASPAQIYLYISGMLHAWVTCLAQTDKVPLAPSVFVFECMSLVRQYGGSLSLVGLCQATHDAAYWFLQ